MSIEVTCSLQRQEFLLLVIVVPLVPSTDVLFLRMGEGMRVGERGGKGEGGERGGKGEGEREGGREHSEWRRK